MKSLILVVGIWASFLVDSGRAFMKSNYYENFTLSIPPEQREDNSNIPRLQAYGETPPYSGTCWQISKTTITSSDPTAYKSIRDAGRGRRKIWDRNWNRWKTVNAYLFKASYKDNPEVEFQVDPSIGYYASREASTWLAKMYGRIPKIFRGCVREFWILPGDHKQGAGGSPHGTLGPSVMTHLDYAKDKQRQGNIEELFLHESSHACLDHLRKTPAWRQAVAWDRYKYISYYAQQNPDREDLSESSTSWYAVRIKRDRQPANDIKTTEATIRNRMDYFDKTLGGKLNPVKPINPTGAPPTKVPPSTCINENQSCDYWARYGECEKNPGYMKIKCKKACDVCGTGQDYYLETRKTSCSGGNLIKDKETCIGACGDLKIPKKSILGGYPCYKDSRGYCYQNGHNGAGASMVCTNKGSAAPPSV